LAVSDLLPLTFSATQNVLTISNIDLFPAEAPFTIVVDGIKNPANPPNPTATGWKIESLFSINTINLTPNFDSFTYGV
jgi:hypothetical protein